ncbi:MULTISPECIES: hypothetical protein [Allobacillus]|uniref:Uncharacterized protein n=1 Tax=Allobacillus salarius TaxID=1955272 RepID=A0A556P8T1_9BACI|nr:hypothetical protein [Allobacillus salarius]TSJ60794.1 hypothetical protein FPQ13_11580 [Allobacillus salarius]
MATKLIESTTRYYNSAEFARHVNEQQGTTYTDVGKAITGLGVSIVSLLITKNIKYSIAYGLGATSALFGLDAVADAFGRAAQTEEFDNILKQMGPNDYVMMFIDSYQWSSGSGNHYTNYQEVKYVLL